MIANGRFSGGAAHAADPNRRTRPLSHFPTPPHCALRGDEASCRTLAEGLQNGHGGLGESEHDASTHDMYKAAVDDRGRVTAQDGKGSGRRPGRQEEPSAAYGHQ